MIPVRRHIRRRPPRFNPSFPRSTTARAVPSVHDLVKQIEDAERAREKQAKQVTVVQAEVQKKEARRRSLLDEIRELRKAARTDANAQQELRRKQAELRELQVGVKRSRAALKREKAEAKSAKQAAKQAKISTATAKEELKRQRLATGLDVVEKRRAIEESKEKLRQERMQRANAR